MSEAKVFWAFVKALGRECGSEGRATCQDFVSACLDLSRKRVSAFTGSLRGGSGIFDPEPEATRVRETARRVCALASPHQEIPNLFQIAERDPFDPRIGECFRDIALQWISSQRSLS